ncbi:thioredoxin [Candidatus Pacearchaeota archaeon]|nr:thioredoxin [Candidatus Pacearchaeota archaeon]
MAKNNIIETKDSDFEKNVIQTSKKTPVLVDFWAEWCYPCRFLSPTLDKLADEYKGKFILAKVNVDENPKSSQENDIRSIPHVKLFKSGKVADEFIGAIPEKKIKEFLAKNGIK